MNKPSVLLLFGGGGGEHDISKRSMQFIQDQLKGHNLQLWIVEIHQNHCWTNAENGEVYLRKNHLLTSQHQLIDQIDFCIPCIHGYPGETGSIQPFLEFCGIDYLGCSQEASSLCFNKFSTKLWLDKFQIPTAPFIGLLNEHNDLQRATQFYHDHQSSGVYLKASSEGSSRGVYKITHEAEINKALSNALKFSKHVIMEKAIVGRELEVAVYSMDGKWHISWPGEIICPQSFYDFNEKYSSQSQTKIIPRANDLDDKIFNEIKDYCHKIIDILNLKDLSRIDLFLDQKNQIYINEVNTFPGLTQISLFPQMLSQSDHSFADFLLDKIKNQL